MSIALLIQVQEEVRRLAIAGSAVASGDFRLKKLVPPLELAGAKVPVFARVAQAAQAVVESNDKSASTTILDLATLVNAILYTQGETGLAGELKPLETTDLGAENTQTSARVLKPLLNALASTGSGRIDLVRDAVDRGTFKDLRLVKAALNALDDPYPDIASLIATKVLPMYGKAIVPELRAKLDLKGRGGHLHRLQLLRKLDPEAARGVVREALDVGSKEIRVAAVECLDTTGDDLSYLLDQVRAKSKDVRAAALRALTGAQNPGAAIADALTKAIDGPDLPFIVDRLRHCNIQAVQEYVVSQASKQLNEVLVEKDVKKQGAAIERLITLVRCLEGRTDPETHALLLRCFEAVPRLAAIKSAPSGEDFNEVLTLVMSRAGTALQKHLASAHESLYGEMLPPAYAAARQTMTPAEFYEEFGATLAHLNAKAGKKGGSGERAKALARALAPGFVHPSYGRSAFPLGFDATDPVPNRELDPRWLDLAVEAGSFELVCRLARPNHAKTNQFLLDQLEGARPAEKHSVLSLMIRLKHPGAADAIIDSLKKQAAASIHSYDLYWYDAMIRALPKSAYAKFEALLPSLPETIVEHLLEPVTELKHKPE